jgi:hypothetical protein
MPQSSSTSQTLPLNILLEDFNLKPQGESPKNEVNNTPSSTLSTVYDSFGSNLNSFEDDLLSNDNDSENNLREIPTTSSQADHSDSSGTDNNMNELPINQNFVRKSFRTVKPVERLQYRRSHIKK